MTASALSSNKLGVALVTAVVATLALSATLPDKIFNMTIVNGGLPTNQRVMAVTKGDLVRLRVISDAPGNLHLHGYQVEMKLAPNKPEEIAFKAYATGRYPFEWHGAMDKAKAARHRGPEFGVLEVYPK